MLLSTPTTSCPCRSKRSTASEPISPLLPVTSTFIRSNPFPARSAQGHGLRCLCRAPHSRNAAIGKEKAAPSLEEYQQPSGFLTVAGRHKSALHEVPTISSGTPDTQRGHS